MGVGWGGAMGVGWGGANGNPDQCDVAVFA